MDMAPDSIVLRTACAADLPALQPLVERAIAELLAPFLSAEQLRASFEIMGLDTQLVADRTYFVAEFDGALAGCGGWSRRGTHFGGDHSPGRDARSLDPAHESARVRAMYTHPAFARRGIGRAVLNHCEQGARAAGFSSVELIATLAGVPLYAASGYHEVNRLAEITPSGIPVPLVEMRKQL
jgi:GNAT superfamily N-acetyltransferase